MHLPTALLVEDSDEDAKLLIDALKNSRLDFQVSRVSTLSEVASALDRAAWDIILVDFQLFGFSALDVLTIVAERKIDTPVIVVSGTVGEDIAVATLKAGAHNYVLKQNVLRLAPAVEREMRAAEARRERNLSIEALQRSEERLHAIVSLAMDAIISINQRQEIILFNRAAENMFRCAAKDAIGQSIDRFIPLSVRKQHRGYVEEFGRTSASRRTMGLLGEISGLRADGEEFPAEASISHSMASDEKLYTVIIRDISDRKRLESQLYHSQKQEALGQLAGGIAHDFNNILGVILGYAQLLQRAVPPESRAASNVQAILAASQRASGLVQQILTFSRQRETKLAPTTLSSIVQEAVKFLGATLPSSIELRLLQQTNHDTVFADPVQLHQLVMNLCTNAAYAMRGRQGSLTLSIGSNDGIEMRPPPGRFHELLAPGEYVHLTVTDEGTGIPIEVQDKIFDPFFTTKPLGEGTGLGLAVVQGIVSKLGGVVSFESTPESGTSFHVFLRSHDESPASESPSDSSVMGNGERILIVDDEELIVSLLKQILESLGYNVRGETNPVTALHLFREQHHEFDILLTDRSMPKKNGEDLIAECRQIRPGFPAILLSGLREEASENEDPLRIPDAVVAKPFTLDELGGCLRRILNQKLSA